MNTKTNKTIKLSSVNFIVIFLTIIHLNFGRSEINITKGFGNSNGPFQIKDTVNHYIPYDGSVTVLRDIQLPVCKQNIIEENPYEQNVNARIKMWRAQLEKLLSSGVIITSYSRTTSCYVSVLGTSSIKIVNENLIPIEWLSKEFLNGLFNMIKGNKDLFSKDQKIIEISEKEKLSDCAYWSFGERKFDYNMVKLRHVPVQWSIGGTLITPLRREDCNRTSIQCSINQNSYLMPLESDSETRDNLCKLELIGSFNGW